MGNSKIWMLAAILTCGTTMAITSCTGKDNAVPSTPDAEETVKAVDYSNEDNWMYLSEATKDVDVFYVYPTEYVDDTEGAPIHAAIDEPAMRLPAMRTSLVQATAFEDVANVYAPFYRQCNMAALAKMSMEDREEAFNSVPKTDVFAALDYYFEHLNGGRPFILAGHSQGSIMQSFVLAEYMKAHPEYLKRMIAAYVIGFSITEDYLKANPHLKFAEGADDTGVIISYNTEAAGNTNNIVVLPGAISINPINWKRDETYASAEESLGGYIFNEETGLPEDYPHAADAKIDLKRGVVITTTKAVAPETFPLFGPASFHENDYPLYYYNIKANAAVRVAAYKNACSNDDNTNESPAQQNAAQYTMAANATAGDVGKVICSNGHIHSNVSDVICGGSASAMIAYVGNQNNANGNGAYSSTCNHGLAIALADVINTSGDPQTSASASDTNRMKWEDAKTACNSFKGSKPSGVTWMLPSAYQWERMLIGCGGTTTYTTSLYDGEKFSYGNFRTQLTNCGTNVQGVYDVQDYTYGYWSSTEYSGGTTIYAWYYRFSISDFRWNYKRERFYVRAAFAF